MGVQVMEFTPVRCNKEAYSEYKSLFARCFPTATQYSSEYLEWLYQSNPDGQVIGFDARDGENLVAHYACIPACASVGGKEVKVLLSLNTATHPDYQGRGLFTQLAERTYAAGADQGFDSVYGVANANSTPGFVRKLNFQLVGSLQAMVGIGALGINFRDFDALQFRRSWSSSTLAWRCASPIRPVISRTKHDHRVFLAPALLGGACMATAEIEEASITSKLTDTIHGFASPLRLFIGMVPPAAQRRCFYINIPEALRPSPLNLIYRSLSGRLDSINPNRVFFTYLDFDAY